VSTFHYYKDTCVVKKLNFYFIEGYEKAYYFLQLAGTKRRGPEGKADTEMAARP